MVNFEQWNGFDGSLWKEEVNVRDFIQKNYKPYDGDEHFLAGPTDATNKLWGVLQGLQKEERAKGGVLDMDTEIVSGITAHEPGYISEDLKDLEAVVGLQTDKPLKRAFMPYGGIKMAEQACSTYGYEPDPELHKIFTEYCKTHNQGVFDAYTPEMKKARHNKIITGLPWPYRRRLSPCGSVRYRLPDRAEEGRLCQLRQRFYDGRHHPSERRAGYADQGSGRDESHGREVWL